MSALKNPATHLQSEQERIKNEFEETKRTLDQEWRQAVRGISNLRGEQPAAMADKAARVAQKNEQRHQTGAGPDSAAP